MISLAAILIALGVADWVASGLGGEPLNRRRALAGVGAAGSAALAVTLALGVSGAVVFVVAVLAVGGSASWLVSRGFGSGAPWRRPRIALIGLAFVLGLALALARATTATAPAWLRGWLDSSAFELAATEPAHIALFAGVVLFLGSTSNAIVRAALTAAGTDWRSSQTRLRGGRLIGVLERWLIFTLAVAGELTAASLIISAKSLLRFPELSRVARSDGGGDSAVSAPAEVDLVTEYFLLGSLLSWTLALVPALLFW